MKFLKFPAVLAVASCFFINSIANATMQEEQDLSVAKHSAPVKVVVKKEAPAENKKELPKVEASVKNKKKVSKKESTVSKQKASSKNEKKLPELKTSSKNKKELPEIEAPVKKEYFR